MSAISFTILTPSFNRGSMIERALASVREQGYPSVQHIVIDGMSSDNTAAVLAKFPKLEVIREPDHGIYDALNKGLARASGDIVGLLNTDDVYTPGTFEAVAEGFRSNAIDAVYGGAEIYELSGTEERVIRRFITPEETALSWENITVGVGTINARFWRRRFMDKVGPFDLRYRISADREWMIRARMQEPQSVSVDRLVYRYLLHGDSLTVHHGEPNYRSEHLQIAREYLARPDISNEVRDWMKRLHSKETIQGAIAAVYRREIGRAFSEIARGIAADAAWPLRFCEEAAASFRRLTKP